MDQLLVLMPRKISVRFQLRSFFVSLFCNLYRYVPSAWILVEQLTEIWGNFEGGIGDFLSMN